MLIIVLQNLIEKICIEFVIFRKGQDNVLQKFQEIRYSFFFLGVCNLEKENDL